MSKVRFTFTDARQAALEVLCRHERARYSTATEHGGVVPRVYWQSADWLVSHGFATHEGEWVTVTPSGHDAWARIQSELHSDRGSVSSGILYAAVIAAVLIGATSHGAGRTITIVAVAVAVTLYSWAALGEWFRSRRREGTAMHLTTSVKRPGRYIDNAPGRAAQPSCFRIVPPRPYDQERADHPAGGAA